MPDKDIDDAFKDFELKVEDKKERRQRDAEPSDSDEAQIRHKFEEEKQALKEKYREELLAIKAKKIEQAIKEGKLSPDRFRIERIIYISIILVLLLYIGFSLWGKAPSPLLETPNGETDTLSDPGNMQNKSNTTESAKTGENKTAPKTETKTETKPASKKPLGNVAFAINNVDMEKGNNNLGYIQTVSFSIQNNRDTVLNPVVHAYIYDEKSEEDWLHKSRGSFTYPAGIAAGKSIDGEIAIVPKTFANLDLDKTIRLELNDSKDGFLKMDSRTVTIE